MMNIENYYFEEKLRKDAFLDESEYNKLQRKLKEKEEKFKNIFFYRRNEYEKSPKYYLQNKIKKDSRDIQETLKKEIDNLNKIYEDNKYFLNIEKEVLKKKENKHIYNIFNITIIEYIKINLFEDLIEESDIFYCGNMKPIEYSRLDDINKLKLYELIENILNTQESYTIKDKDNNISYHNDFFNYYADNVFEFFIDLYSNENTNNILEYISIIAPESKFISHIDIKSILEWKNTKENEEYIKNIINNMIDLNWELENNILNVNLLNELYQENRIS